MLGHRRGPPRDWARLLWAAAPLVLGCSDGEYRVVLHVPGGDARAARIELAVLPSCADIRALGDEPVSALRVIDALDDSPIGSLSAGAYGLYTRAWEADCTLYAAACRPFDVEGGGQGTIDVFLTEISPRGCAADESCVEGACLGGPDGGAGWLLVDDTDEDFDLGDPGTATQVAGDAVSLRPGESTGMFTSRTASVPVASARGSTLAWTPRAPYGKGLPDVGAGSAETDAYAEGGVDVSQLVLLLHLEGAAGEAVREGQVVTDASGRGHDAEVVDLAGLEDSSYRDGRIGAGLYVRRDDYLRIPDATTDEDFAFGDGDFTWAAWVRIPGCELSEDNVIALGGEVPHIWLGAACPEGVAVFQVSDDDGFGDGIESTQQIVDDRWHHLVGVKTSGHSPRTVLYVDGTLAASMVLAFGTFSNFTKELLIGNFPIGDPPVYQYRSELEVDEVTVFKRALTSDEVVGLFRRGALRLHLQVRACPADGCTAEEFVGPDGTSATFFSDLDDAQAAPPPPSPLPAVVTGGVFQYRATFESDDPTASPVLERVELAVSAPGR